MLSIDGKLRLNYFKLSLRKLNTNYKTKYKTKYKTSMQISCESNVRYNHK